MSAHLVESGDHKEPAPADLETAIPAVLPASTEAPGPAMRRVSATLLPLGPATQPAALERIHWVGNRALGELTYQLRRLGTATLAGCVAITIAVIVFITGNLPQVSANAALKDELARLSPSSKHPPGAGPTGAGLASLPPRAEAPDVVAKILEEAEASGVELPRGQYEYIPARDGVAARYRMTFPVNATYPKIRAFMDRTLVAMPAVAIEGLRIERKNVADDSVDAELKLSAYVRSDP